MICGVSYRIASSCGAHYFLSGAHYFLTIADDFSLVTWVNLLVEKKEVSQNLKNFFCYG